MSDIVERLRAIEWTEAERLQVMAHVRQQDDEITRLRAENEKLRVEAIQMQAALGYGICAEDERHIIPTNPYKCGTCDASKHLRAEVERLRETLVWIADTTHPELSLIRRKARAALEERTMKLNIDDQHFLNAVDREGDREVGAGRVPGEWSGEGEP